MDEREERLLAVAQRIADAASDEPSDSSFSVAEEMEAEGEDLELILMLKEIASVIDAQKTLDRIDLRGTWSAPAPGYRWAHLELLEELGTGTSGDVFRARDTRLGHQVALKLFRAHRLSPTEKEVLLEEGRLHAKVKHPNVVTVHSADEHGGRVGIWMEYIDGRTLKELVTREGPLGASEATHIGIELCRALAAIHFQGLTHGDVKAQNVMREKGGRIVLMDFSTSRPIEERSSKTELGGTPLYMAPELLSGGRASPRTDVYSLGVLLFYLVTAEFPVYAETLDELRDRLARGDRRRLSDQRPDLPRTFVQVVSRALSFHPEERFASAGAFQEALAAAVVAVDSSRTPPDGRDGSEALGPSITASLREVKSLARVLRAGGVIASIIVVVGFLGFLSSMALNVTLGRNSDFASESVVDWLVWGVRSLIPPAIYMALLAGAFLFISLIWRFMKNAITPLDSWLAEMKQRLAAMRERAGLDDTAKLAQCLFVAGTLGLAWIWWEYWNLIGAYTSVLGEGASSLDLAPLRPDRADRVTYGRSLDVLILLLSVGWYRVFRGWKKNPRRAGLAPLIATAAVIAVALLSWVVPYRIMFHNRFERVDFEGQRAYIIGRRDSELLLYRPGSSSGTHQVVTENDSRVRRRHVIESIFTQ